MFPSSSRSPTKDASSPVLAISVIVPVRNEGAYIAETLRALRRQNYPADRFEVLVVDGCSTDDTREIVRQIADVDRRVRLLENPRRWSSAARNIGVRASTGDVVVIIDGHTQLQDGEYLTKLAAAFRQADVQCVGRPQPLDVHGGSTLQRAIALARSSGLGHHPDSFIYADADQYVPAHSVAVAYRRAVFDDIGFFDETFDACEDVEFNHRVDKAGKKCLLASSVRLHYYPRNSLRSLFRQLARYGRGRMRLARKHPETTSLKSLAPGLLVAFLGLGGLSFLVSPFWGYVYLAISGAYLAFVILYCVRLAYAAKDWPALPWLPCAFLSIHGGAGWGVLYEFLRGGIFWRSASPRPPESE